jgi:hypothetical protein
MPSREQRVARAVLEDGYAAAGANVKYKLAVGTAI